MVKNSTGIFSKGRVNMGQLHLDLSQFDDLTKASTEWFDMFTFVVEFSPFFALYIISCLCFLISVFCCYILLSQASDVGIRI